MITFDTVYNENHKWVRNLIRNRTNNCPECDEMTNDVFMKVHENLNIFDENKCQTGLVGWIRTFAFNKIIDYYRRKKIAVSFIEEFKDDDGKEILIIKDSVDIEKEYCTNEMTDMVKNIIKMLPNPYKTVATLFYIKDYTHNEIVQQTGMSVGTIKVQLNRARTKIQREFGVA